MMSLALARKVIEAAEQKEVARSSVESERPSEFIGYATAAPFAIGFLETAFAIEDNNMGICR